MFVLQEAYPLQNHLQIQLMYWMTELNLAFLTETTISLFLNHQNHYHLQPNLYLMMAEQTNEQLAAK